MKKNKIHLPFLNNYQKRILANVITTSFPEVKIRFEKKNLNIYSKISKKQNFDLKKVIKSISCIPQSNKINLNKSSRNKCRKDPLYALQKRKEVIWIGQGMPVYTGRFLKIKKILETKFEKVAVKFLRCLEVETPALWTKSIFEKTKYLSDFPHEAIFCLAAKKDSQSLSKIANTQTLSSDKLDPKHLNIIGGLQPSVCTTCYAIASTLKNNKNLSLTTFNKVFRNEGEYSLTRIKSFSVRDLIAIGTRSFADQKIRQFELETLRFLKSLDLEFSVESANDPFFMSSSNKIAFQNIYNLKKEINFHINSKSKFAIGSINNHLNTFGSAFNLKLKSHGSLAYSCCLGIGFDRLTYAMFYQFGQNLNRWPAIIRNQA